MGDAELTLHVEECFLQGFSPTQNVVDDYVCIEMLVNCEAARPGKVLPSSVQVMSESNECGRAVDGAERHDVVRPLSRIGPAKASLAWESGATAI